MKLSVKNEETRFRLMLDALEHIICSHFDLPFFMQAVCDRMVSLTDADGATIEMAEGDMMVYRATSGSLQSSLGVKVHRLHSLSGLCVAEQAVLYSSDTETDERVDREATRRVGARSMICVPLFESGRAIGVLKVVSSQIDAFSPLERDNLQLLSLVLGAELGKQTLFHEKELVTNAYKELLDHLQQEIAHREVLEKELVQRADYDSLTGLLNRRAFSNELHHWITDTNRHAGTFAVYYLDLDKFKDINDQFGHDIGDLALIEFSKRLQQVVNATDLIARFGGDEFVMASWLSSTNEKGLRIAKDLITSLSRTFVYKNISMLLKTSIGIAYWSNEMTENDLIKIADQSMYLAKMTGTNQIAVEGVIVSS